MIVAQPTAGLSGLQHCNCYPSSGSKNTRERLYDQKIESSSLVLVAAHPRWQGSCLEYLDKRQSRRSEALMCICAKRDRQTCHNALGECRYFELSLGAFVVA